MMDTLGTAVRTRDQAWFKDTSVTNQTDHRLTSLRLEFIRRFKLKETRSQDFVDIGRILPVSICMKEVLGLVRKLAIRR